MFHQLSVLLYSFATNSPRCHRNLKVKRERRLAINITPPYVLKLEVYTRFCQK